MESNFSFSIHHIGGRRATTSLKDSFFKNDCLWTFYDADESCLEQIKCRTDGEWTQILPYCLFSSRQKVKFHINQDPTTSSIFELDNKFGEFYLDHDYPLYGPMDFRFADTINTVKEIELECTTIDLLVQEDKAVAPDILSIDAQGASYDILEGSKECLVRDTIAVSCECEFVPFYKGQKTFGHVSNFMNDHGFIFCCFQNLTKGSMYRESVGFRGDGFHVYCDALFLKDIDTIAEESSGADAVKRLYKLAYTALVYNCLEYSIRCLRIIESKFGSEIKPEWKFVSVLDGLMELVDSSNGIMLQSFMDVFPADANLRRFNANEDIVDYDAYSRLLDVLPVLAVKAEHNNKKSILVISYRRFCDKIVSDVDLPAGIDLFLNAAIPDDAKEPIGCIGEIPDSCYVLLTASHKSQELKKELLDKGVAEDCIFVTGYFIPEADDGYTNVERYLCSCGFVELSEMVRNKRIKQSYARNYHFPS